MAVSMFKCYPLIHDTQSSLPIKYVCGNISPGNSAMDLSSYERQHFQQNLSPISSNESFDIIGEQDDSSPILRRKSRFQMPQRNCGEDIGFDVELEGKETFKARNMYYIRQGEYFSMGISFAAELHNKLNHIFVRITPSWSVQRPEASTVIYCCNKHIKNSPAATKLEQHSMLRAENIGTYEIDDASDRLSILVPMATKDCTSPFWINLKSECFSSCGSSQKKAHHLITVTLELINSKEKAVIGRRIFRTKFSSSPSRDIRNCSRGSTQLLIGNEAAPKRCDFGKRCASLHKIQSSAKVIRPSSEEDDPGTRQVTFLPVKKKYVERVKSYLRYLQNEDGDEESVGETDVLSSSSCFPDAPSDLDSQCPSLQTSCDLEADLMSILDACDPAAAAMPCEEVRFSPFFLPEACTVIAAPLVAQSSAM